MTPPGLVPRAACSSAWASACWRAAERTSTGRTGSRSRVRASIRDLRCRWTLPWMVSARPTGHGAAHCRPPAGVIDGPLGQVEVEGPHRGQELAVADPLGVDHGLAAVGGGDGLLAWSAAAVSRRRRPRRSGAGCRCRDGGVPGRPRTCPGGGRAAPGSRSRWRAGVRAGSRRAGHGWAAGELVTADHLLGRALARGAQLAQPGRRGRAEDPHLAQQPVAGGGCPLWPRHARRPRCPAARADHRW